MNQPTRRAAQARERRAQLLDAALALFAEQGFERATIKDLSEAAGVTQGLVYHYFRGKDELLFAVLERQSFLPELRRLLAVAPDRPAAEVLREIAAGFAALLAEREPLMRIVARESQTNPRVAAVLQRVIEEAVGLLAGYLDARIRAGELRPHHPRVTARTLFYLVVMLRLTRTPADGFLPAFVDTLLRGVAAH
jgi:AcrR family transcriptional regulator